MPPPPRILQVAVNTPLYSLFDYLEPAGNGEAKPGQRVRVPFGRREQVGVIVGVASESALPAERLRPAGQLLDTEPLLDAHLIDTLLWSAAYYQAPQPVNLSQVRPLFHTIEHETSDYILGTMTPQDNWEAYDPHVYIHGSGWMLVVKATK